MQNIKTKDFLAYVGMPRIIPRARNLFASGFAYIPFLMAHIYLMARLLPNTHPYLKSSNIGRFGISHVIMEATRNLKFSYKNSDQLFIYFAMMAGVVMLVAQILVLVYSVIISPAMAFSWFETTAPQTDIAFTLLDRVFGIPGIFCNSAAVAPWTTGCTDYSVDTNGVAPGIIPIPLPFHIALHGLFEFYSMALLSIAVLIFLYFVVVVLLETIVSGTPFGQRFQNVWVPIRLIVALGLLMPVGLGINSGQYIVLYVAKFGSSFATVGWNHFNDGITSHSMFAGGGSNPIGEKYSLLAIPEAPDVTSIIEAMSIIHACAYAYHRLAAGSKNVANPTMPDYTGLDANYVDSTTNNFRVQPFLVKKKETWMVANPINPPTNNIVGEIATSRFLVNDAPSYDHLKALGFYFGNDIIIRFGEFSAGLYDGEVGNVKPLCGDVKIPVVNLSDPGGADVGRGGADAMLQFYYRLILNLWFFDDSMRQFSRSYVESTIGTVASRKETFCTSNEVGGGGVSLSGTGTSFPGFFANATALPPILACDNSPPTSAWRQELIKAHQLMLSFAITSAWSDYVLNSIYKDMSPEVKAYGWGGAGIWYNKLAEINSGWMDSVNAVPTLDRYPLAMEQVLAEKKKQNETVEQKERFNPSVKAQSGQASSSKIVIGEPLDDVAIPLARVYSYWNEGMKNFDIATRSTFKNIFMDAINRLMGTGGLAAMRGANAHLHPLAQLVIVGKGLVDSAVFNLAGSTGTAFLGGMAGAMKGYETSSAVFNAASEVLLSTAFMGLTAGFVLFYILPFLPFVYFYFAVASWIKAIFEAMVGVPLWALAHLRIDGDGLPGDSAQNGYFLILEIFIRPILTVVGLVAAIIIFSTQVRILNLLWDLVVVNTSGHTPSGNDILGMQDDNDTRFGRNIIDQFFFTIIYTIVCYMMALASFKLIDKIPDNILRWAGSGVSSFGDINQDNIESLNRYASMGGLTIGSQAAGAVKSLGGGLGRATGGVVEAATSAPKGTPPPGGVSIRTN